MELGRVLDKDALDGATGATGLTSINVPADWLLRGDTIEFIVPLRLACARCEGGGCDRCERRGGLRLEGDEAARRVRLSLPTRAETSAFVVRLVRPLGDGAGLEQLTIRIGVAALPSAGCERVQAPVGESAPALRRVLVAGALVLLLAAAVAALVTAMHR
jgi:hypothetical protein